MAGTKVGDIFMGLALHPDMGGFNAGIAATNAMASKIKQLATQAAIAKLDAQKLGEQLGVLERKAPASHWDKIKASGDGVTSTFWRMAGAALAFVSAAKIAGMVKETVDLGSHLNDTAQKTGLSTDALQKWGYAAKLNGADAEAFEGSTIKLSKGLALAAQTGKGPAVEAFKELGLSMQDPAIKSRDLNAILYMVANKFSTMPDGAKKTAIAMDLFGRSGAQMIPTLNQGVAGIAAASAELTKLGGVMDGDAISHLDDFGDNIDRVKTAFGGLKNQAVIALMPLLEQLMTQFQEWIANNQELIKDTLKNAVEALAVAVKVLGEVVAFAVRHWKALAIILGGMTIVNGIMKIIKAVIAFQAFMASAAAEAIVAWIMILGPILLVIAAIVLVGLAIYVLRDKIWAALQAVGRFFADLYHTVVDAVSRAIEASINAFEDFWVKLKKGFTEAWDMISNLPAVKEMLALVNAIQALLSTKNPDKRTPEQVDESARSASIGSEADALYGPSGYYQASGAVGPTAELTPADRARIFGAPAAPPTAPAREFSNPNTSASTVTNSYSIQIDAKNADASQVAQLVDDKIREHDERTRRDTAAALGVGDL